MDSTSSLQTHSIDMPTTQSTVGQKAPDVTPSKRKGSPLGYQIFSDTKAQSTPNPLREEQDANSSLKTPDRPISRKRAKSASGRSPGADSVAQNDDATASPNLGTPGSCTRKENYKYEGSRLKHLRNCPDPKCRMRPASTQPSASDDDETQSPKTQEQRAGDMFTTISPKNQAEPLRFSLSDNVHKSSGESPFPKERSNLSAETFETTEELHIQAPGSDKAADQEPDRLYSEAPSGQDQPNLEDTPGHIRSRSRANIISMQEKLRAKFEMRLSPKDEKGHIYVMKDLNRPHLCKIGKAKESQLRVATIKKSCGLDLELAHCKPVDLYTRTEALIQAYLSDFCLPYLCESCNRTHSEWFEISDELAIAAVEKWVNFMCRESPYDSSSKELKPFWSVWLEFHNFASADLDVDGFRMWWDRIMSPSKLDHFNYRFKPVWEKLWKFFWPVYATLAWTVTFIAFQHPATFFLMIASVIGTFVSMSHDFHSLRHAST